MLHVTASFMHNNFISPDVAQFGTRLDCNPEVAGSSQL